MPCVSIAYRREAADDFAESFAYSLLVAAGLIFLIGFPSDQFLMRTELVAWTKDFRTIADGSKISELGYDFIFCGMWLLFAVVIYFDRSRSGNRHSPDFFGAGSELRNAIGWATAQGPEVIEVIGC